MIYDDMSNDEYHARSELGSTSTKTLAKYPPAVYRWQADNPQPHKAAFDLGTAAHGLILEGDVDGVFIIPGNDYRKTDARNMRDQAYAEGKTPLLTKEWDQVKAMADAVHAHPIAGPLFTGHIPEQSYFTKLHGVPVKARPDALNGTTVVDLKTTAADLNDLARTVNNFGYYIQQAHYTAVMEECGQKVDDFVFVFVSTTAPHAVRVIRLEHTAVVLGNEHMYDALTTFKACTKSGKWPGYDEIDTVDLPAWVYYQDENEETEIVI